MAAFSVPVHGSGSGSAARASSSNLGLMAGFSESFSQPLSIPYANDPQGPKHSAGATAKPTPKVLKERT